jgi:methionyl-tRNA synthetase
VSTVQFEQRYESELANELGNLASRTTSMLVRYRGGIVPDVPLDDELVRAFDGITGQVAGLLDHAEITQALEAIWERVRRLNAYVAETAPWQLAKDEEKTAELDRALASVIEGVRVLTVLLAPYLPETTSKLAAALGTDDLGYEAAGYGAGRLDQVVQLEPLFPRVQQ